jgi:hypothetical protein
VNTKVTLWRVVSPGTVLEKGEGFFFSFFREEWPVETATPPFLHFAHPREKERQQKVPVDVDSR